MIPTLLFVWLLGTREFQALETGCSRHLKLGVPGLWNWVFQALELGVSGLWNWVFQALELGVSGLGTRCFRPWNWVFQALKLGVSGSEIFRP